MAVVGNQFNKVVRFDGFTPADVVADISYVAINIDASNALGAEIFAIDAVVDPAEADRPNMATIHVAIIRNIQLTVPLPAINPLIVSGDLVYDAQTERAGDESFHREWFKPFPVDKGNRYSIVVFPGFAIVPGNNFTISLTVMGNYISPQVESYYKQPR